MKEQDKQRIIKWLNIRLNNIPLVDRQHRHVQHTIRQLRQEVQQGDILALQKLSTLYSSIKTRIQQIDAFYNQHFMDQRVKYLQGSRVILNKLIFNHQNYVERFQIISSQLPWRKSDQKHSISGNNSSIQNHRKEKVKQNFNASTQRHNHTQRQTINFNQLLRPKSKQKSIGKKHPINIVSNQEKQVQASDIKKQVTPSKGKIGKKVQSHISVKNIRKSLSPFDKSPNFLSLTPKDNKANFNPKPQKRLIPSFKQNSNKIYSSQSNRAQVTANNFNQKQKESATLKNLSELVFTIKMTKQEYKNFVKLKSQASQRK